MYSSLLLLITANIFREPTADKFLLQYDLHFYKASTVMAARKAGIEQKLLPFRAGKLSSR